METITNDTTVSNIVYATTQALTNTGAKSVALTNSKPLEEMIKKNGETHAEAFEWHITKLPEDQIVPAKTVREIALALFSDVYITRARNAAWTDEQIREHILQNNATYSQLSRTHPRLILMLTGSDCTPRKIQHMLELMELRAQHEVSTMSLEEKQKQVSAYFQSSFVRQAEPGEEERAVNNGTGIRGTMVQGPPVSS